MAEYYSAELAQKIRRGMHENALKCKSTGAGIPLGYTVDPETKLFQEDPEGAQAVRTIFDMYIAGESNAAICAFLNGRGFKTAKKNAFNKNSVNHIIANRKYLGEYSYNGVTTPGGMPQIISEEVFAMAQAEHAKRKTRRTKPAPKGEYLLAGKLFCGHCKTAMIGVSGTSKTGAKHYYYYCPNNRAPKKDCCKKQISRDDLETRVVDLTLEYVLRRDVLENVSRAVWELQSENDTTKEELKLYETNLRDNKKAVDRVIQAIEAGVDPKTLVDRMRALTDEQAILEGEIARLKTVKPNLSEDQILFALMLLTERKDDEDDLDYRRRIIECFVSQVYLWNDRIVIFFNISSPDGALRPDDLAEIENAPVDLSSTSASFGGPDSASVEPLIRALAYGLLLAKKL
jgi:hypothetical protein